MSNLNRIDSANAQVKRLVLAQLKTICRCNALAVSGTKAILQARITNLLETHGKNDLAKFEKLRMQILNPETTVIRNITDKQALSPRASTKLALPIPSNNVPLRPPFFATSCFYTLEEALSKVAICGIREFSRDTARFSVNVTRALAQSLTENSAKRVMLFGAEEPNAHTSQRVNVQFPHQVDVRVNQQDIKTSLRGLRNKPGTTRPADITKFLHRSDSQENEVVVTYAQTTQRFLLIVYLVKYNSVQELIAKLESGRRISKSQVLRELFSKMDDEEEILATSAIMSLNCPLSTQRIETPCRSTACSHSQCFDASSFLQLQEQAPTWCCPICSKNVNFDSLMIDEYMVEVLKSVPLSASQILVEPDGSWSVPVSRKNDELNYVLRGEGVETLPHRETQVPNVPIEGQSHAFHNLSTAVRSTDAASISLEQQSKVIQAIDLTISSEEDDEQEEIPISKRRRIEYESLVAGAEI